MIIPRIPGIRAEVRLDSPKVQSKAPVVSSTTILRKNSVSDDTAQARTAICKACPRYRPNTDVCGVCGCGAVVAQRARSILGKCPEGKWDL